MDLTCTHVPTYVRTHVCVYYLLSTSNNCRKQYWAEVEYLHLLAVQRLCCYLQPVAMTTGKIRLVVQYFLAVGRRGPSPAACLTAAEGGVPDLTVQYT